MSLLIGKTEHKFVTAIATPSSGYRVAIPHPTVVGKLVGKNFLIKRQTQTERLAAALEWRDATYKKLYRMAPPVRSFHRQQENSNTSLPGVSLIEKNSKKRLADGKIAAYATLCVIARVFTIPGSNYAPPRGCKTKLYSVRKYGEDEALRLAVEWRARMIEALATAKPHRSG